MDPLDVLHRLPGVHGLKITDIDYTGCIRTILVDLKKTQDRTYTKDGKKNLLIKTNIKEQHSYIGTKIRKTKVQN